MERRAQISIEYITIVTAIVALLVIPAAVFLSSFASSNIQDTLTEGRAKALGELLTRNSEQVYYLGVYSKKQASLDIPQGLERFRHLKITTEGVSYDYIILDANNMGQAMQFIYQVDVPIIFAGASQGPTNFLDIAECTDGSSTCTGEEFTNEMIRPGTRNLLFESKPGPIVEISSLI